jgi:hypothetical protein
MCTRMRGRCVGGSGTSSAHMTCWRHPSTQAVADSQAERAAGLLLLLLLRNFMA